MKAIQLWLKSICSGLLDYMTAAHIECFDTTVDFDYHMRVLCADNESYNEFLESSFVSQFEHTECKTNVILKQVKSNTPIRGVAAPVSND